MNRKTLEVTLARYAVVTLVISSIVLSIASISDVLGTWGFAQTLVPAGDQWAVLIVTATLFAVTTAIQLQAGGMAYDSGTIMYVAGIGAFLRLFGVRAGGRGEGRAGFMATCVESFEKVEARWGGVAWIMLFVWPSLVFDGITDYLYLSQTKFYRMAPLGFLSSFVTEQFLMLSSVSITMIKTGYPPKPKEAAEPSFGGSRERAR